MMAMAMAMAMVMVMVMVILCILVSIVHDYHHDHHHNLSRSLPITDGRMQVSANDSALLVCESKGAKIESSNNDFKIFSIS